MIDISIEILDDKPAFLDKWRKLFARAREATFFQSPQWMEAWLSGAPPQTPLYVIEASAGDELMAMGVVACAPRKPAIAGESAVLLSEFGDQQRDAVYVEYNDFLLAEHAP